MNDQRLAHFPLGHTVTLAELDADPYAVYARLRPTEPLSWLPATGMYYALTHDLVQRLLLDDQNFVVGWDTSTVYDTFGTHTMSCEGRDARRQKRPFRPAFLPVSIRQTLEPDIRNTAIQLVETFRQQGEADIRPAFAARLPILVMLNLFGLPATDEALFRSWYDDFEAALANEQFDPAIRARGQKAVAAFHAHLQPAIEAARARPADASLMAALAHDAREDGLSNEEIRRNALIVMFGGISTVEALILNTMWTLAHHPDWLEKVRTDRACLPAVLEESIRLIGPVQSATRMVTRDIEVDGVPLKQGDIVNLILSAANHDPAVFKAPREFRPDRPEISRHVGFAAGPHLCLGMHLARTQARTALSVLFDLLPGLVPDIERSSPPTGAVFRQPSRLVISWS